MNKLFFTIAENVTVADRTKRMKLVADDPDFKFQGEFIDIAVNGFFLRRPISVCDCGAGYIIIYYKIVGAGTARLAGMNEGQRLDVLSGLGKGFDCGACHSSALLVAGGLGAAPLYLVAKRLVQSGKKVTVVLGFNRSSEIILEDEFRGLGADVHIATLDGSAGVKGFVTDAISRACPEYDYFYTCGPMVMMKAVCAALQSGGQASLEERMGCGAGFCYGCTVNTKKGPARVCKDGPVFDKEDILW